MLKERIPQLQIKHMAAILTLTFFALFFNFFHDICTEDDETGLTRNRETLSVMEKRKFTIYYCGEREM